jgi:hypothetical protein
MPGRLPDYDRTPAGMIADSMPRIRSKPGNAMSADPGILIEQYGLSRTNSNIKPADLCAI